MRWTNKAEVLSSVSTGLSVRWFPRHRNEQGPFSGAPVRPEQRETGRTSSSCPTSSPQGGGAAAPTSSLGDQLEGLSCAIGASVPGWSPPGETRREGGAGHRGAPMAVLVKVPVRACLGEQGTPAERLLGVDLREAGAGVGSSCSPEPAIAFGKPPWWRCLAGVQRTKEGRQVAAGVALC